MFGKPTHSHLSLNLTTIDYSATMNLTMNYSMVMNWTMSCYCSVKMS